MQETDAEPTPTRAAVLALGGLALTLAGVVGYFVIALHFAARLPQIRNDAVPNRIAIAVGLALALLAVIRASRGRRRLSLIVAGANVVVAGAFALMLTVGSSVPSVAGPTIGHPAPAFALADQSGTTVRLEDFRGAPLLLVFYRGHW